MQRVQRQSAKGAILQELEKKREKILVKIRKEEKRRHKENIKRQQDQAEVHVSQQRKSEQYHSGRRENINS